VAAAPDFERQNFFDETAVADVADLFLNVGLEPDVKARLPESVNRGIGPAAAGNQVDGEAFEKYERRRCGSPADAQAEARATASGGCRPAGRACRVREEQVHVAVSQIRTFGVGAGEGDGFEVFVIAPRAEQ
jgi:hypothetical protein